MFASVLWAELAVESPRVAAVAAAAALTEAGCGGVVTHDPFATSSDPFAEWGDVPRGIPTSDSPCRVCGYFPVDDRIEGVVHEVKVRLRILCDAGVLPDDAVLLRTVDDSDWADAWKAHFHPFRVGRRLVVKPTWEPWEAQADDLILELDPGMAFGTGAHPSTQLCLLSLEATVRRGERVLDWGAGSGILSLAALRLGAASALALDLDPIAVCTTVANARQNGLDHCLEVRVGTIEDLPVSARFDRILGNIVADPILAAATCFRRHLHPGGELLVSGVTIARVDEVRTALSAWGLEFCDELAQEEWRALRFRAE